MMVSSERFSSDLSEYTLLKTKKIFLSIKLDFQVKNEKILGLFQQLFSYYFQSLAILRILMIVWENHTKNYQTTSSFYSKHDLSLIKNGIISIEIMGNSGNYNYLYAHLFFGNNFYSNPLYWYEFCVSNSRHSPMLINLII